MNSGSSGASARAADLDAALIDARHAAADNHIDDADAAFQRVLAIEPGNLEALNYCAQRALLAGRATRAIELLEQAVAHAPDNEELWKNLGLARIAAGQPERARDDLQRALQLAPKFFVARLFLAQMEEAAGHASEALADYFGAVMQAQAQGRWLSEATTAPALRNLVLNAMRIIETGRRQLFVDALEPLRTKYGDAALARVQACVDTYLGETPAHYPDPRQRPKFLYFPGLPATTYFDRALFPWYAQLESKIDVIRDELLAVLRDDRGIEPFLKFDTPDQTEGHLAGEGAEPNWDAFFFYRHGERNDANCARCPRTAAILDALPLVRIREHAPEICFSMLTPGTHILPHRGVTNTRVVTHLPLIVPENCAIVVGAESREWREGECFTFDDTYEHEAWNRGASTRVVMLMDSCNPHLSEIEREAVTVLVAVIGDFNRAAGISSD